MSLSMPMFPHEQSILSFGKRGDDCLTFVALVKNVFPDERLAGIPDPLFQDFVRIFFHGHLSHVGELIIHLY